MLPGPFLFFAEQVGIALEHGGHFVTGDLHAVFNGTPRLPGFVSTATAKVVKQAPDVLWVFLCPFLAALRAVLLGVELGQVIPFLISTITAVERSQTIDHAS